MLNPFCGTILWVLLSASVIGEEPFYRRYLIVWNVGQGQWATQVSWNECQHFDMGGERSPLARVRRLCGRKRNQIFLSHWDWDHVGFSGKARSALKNSCLSAWPDGKASFKKRKLLEGAATCAPDELFRTQELTAVRTSEMAAQKPSNHLSHVFLTKDGILLPGDSPTSEEPRWFPRGDLRRVNLLVLGHHGSRTSTSDALLAALPRLRHAVASARKRRYGHPHIEVVRRLQKRHIPLLRTEDWGHLWFELGPSE